VKFRSLKLITVIAPALFIGIGGFLVLHEWDHFFHSTAGFIVLLAAGGLASLVFSLFAFRAIERLEEKVVEQNRRLNILANIAAVTMDSLDLQEILNLALDQVLALTESEAGTICLLDHDAEELVAACYRGLSDEVAAQIQRQKLGAEPIGTQAVLTGKPVVVEDIFAGPEIKPRLEKEGFKALVSVPLKAADEVSGVLAIAKRASGGYPPSQVELMMNIGTQLGLAIRNAVLLAKTRQRNDELAAMLSVGRASSALELDALLDEALTAVASVTSADAAELWLATPDGGLELRGGVGVNDAGGKLLRRLPPGVGLPGRVMATGGTIVIGDIQKEPTELREAVCRDGFVSFCLSPLRSKEALLGVIGVVSKQAGTFQSPSLVRLVEGISEQLAVAVENARLHERVLDVAVLEERERIARELHDGLAQVLGYINTQTMATRRLIEVGRSGDASEQLRLMEEAARSVYGDVREAILGLSSPLPAAGGLVDAVRTYVAQFERMVPFKIAVRIEPEVGLAGLPATTEIQAMRIVQEALSNVRKHASAGNVDITFGRENGGLTLAVVDDGAGFDARLPTPAEWPQFGLQSMKERAKSIRGTLNVDSQLGQGTSVRLFVPLNGMAGVEHARPAGR
jgi:nitrate/nitrite-specific signal transduction histidine kinase